MRGTILRIADLRSQSAYIRVAVRRPTSSRRMVELSFVPHHVPRGHDVAAATPMSRSFVLASLRALHLDIGDPVACQESIQAPNLRFDAPRNNLIIPT